MPKHVVILGAGVIGLSSALACARRGWQVTIVDRQPARRDGCSFGNAGMVVPSHFVPLAAPGMAWRGLKWMADPESPFYIKPRLDRDLVSWGWRFWRAATARRVAAAAPALRDLSLLSRQGFEELAISTATDFGLEKRGLIMLCKQQRTLDEEGHTAEWARELGIPAEVMDARGISALDPAITMDVMGGVYFPLDCHLTPGRFMEALERELKDIGAEFVWATEIAGFRTESGRVVTARTAAGENIEGDAFVLGGGVWSAEAGRSLDLRIPMQAGKGYSLTLSKPRQLPALCSICTEARLAVTPLADGSLRIGGTMELAGIDETVNSRRVRGIIRAVPDYFPAFNEKDFEGIVPWAGLRPVSPDGLPYLGRTRRWSNLIVATGHAMMGLSLAPGTARVVADLLTGETPPVALELFSPDRFGAH
jgi:D-amino-acid dehydrogenase